MLRILIVEDDEDLRNIYYSLLSERLCAAISLAPSANEAIRILKGNTAFDVIISDYKMSDGMGIELLGYVVNNQIDSYFIFFTSTISPEIGLVYDRFLGVVDKMNFEELVLMIQRQISP